VITAKFKFRTPLDFSLLPRALLAVIGYVLTFTTGKLVAVPVKPFEPLPAAEANQKRNPGPIAPTSSIRAYILPLDENGLR